MNLQALDDEILSLQIIGIASSFAQGKSILVEKFVRLDEVSDKILGGYGFYCEFLNTRPLGQGLEATYSEFVQGTDVLGDFVHGSEQLLILSLKSDMELKKIRPLHIPVSEVGLSH